MRKMFLWKGWKLNPYIDGVYHNINAVKFQNLYTGQILLNSTNVIER
jgi:hypothetical protein